MIICISDSAKWINNDNFKINVVFCVLFYFYNFFLVNQGHENSVGQWCPTFLLGAFSYTHNTGSVVTCNTASNLDVCANWTTLTFDYAKCPTVQAFSGKCN